MDFKKKREQIIASAEKALTQLDKLIVQNIDLAELDPEKAAAAAKGKIEAIEGSFRIIQRIQEELALLEDKENEKNDKKSFFGVEGRVKK